MKHYNEKNKIEYNDNDNEPAVSTDDQTVDKTNYDNEFGVDDDMTLKTNVSVSKQKNYVDEYQEEFTQISQDSA